MSDLKMVKIVGDAANMMGGKKKRCTRKAKIEKAEKEKMHGGYVKGVESDSLGSASTNPDTWLKYPAGAPVPPAIQPSQPSPGLLQGGKSDTKQFKVELKKKIAPKKVHLNPKKDIKTKKQTKKVRKFTLGISTFHKRITRAKKLHKKVKELSLENLKEKLIKEGLIKSTSKAPESVLRQIASDAEVVSKKAL